MKWSKVTLEGSYRFDEAALTTSERELWRSLPMDLRRTLRETNGAWVKGQPTFSTRIARTMQGGKIVYGQTNWLEELWGFIPRRQRPRLKGPHSILHEHFARHLGENFLPSNVIVFGTCEQSCLVAVSTNEHDYGAIYYWEWYWQYPWYKPFFDKRLDRVRKRWPNRNDITPGHPDYDRMRDDFNYATIVKIAPSFKAWTDSMK